MRFGGDIGVVYVVWCVFELCGLCVCVYLCVWVWVVCVWVVYMCGVWEMCGVCLEVYMGCVCGWVT